MKVTAIVLAAGSATRFGSPKLLADLDGRPVLRHVLDAAEAAGLDDAIVVLGDEHAAMERTIGTRRHRVVVNPRPADGLSSSLRIGLAAAAADPDAEAAIVLLGDQPRITPAIIRAVLDAAATTDRPFVRARYATDGAPNPVLVRRTAWADAETLAGDRGLGPLLAARPQDVLSVDVEGANPGLMSPETLVAPVTPAPHQEPAVGVARNDLRLREDVQGGDPGRVVRGGRRLRRLRPAPLQPADSGLGERGFQPAGEGPGPLFGPFPEQAVNLAPQQRRFAQRPPLVGVQ